MKESSDYEACWEKENAGGIIPKVMETIFKRVQTMKESSEFLIRVSFIEVNNNAWWILSVIEIELLKHGSLNCYIFFWWIIELLYYDEYFVDSQQWISNNAMWRARNLMPIAIL